MIKIAIQSICCSLAGLLISTSPLLAQVRPLEVDRQSLENNPKAYCTPTLGQAVYNGAIVTVPMGYDCSSWLNYLLQRDIIRENTKVKREEIRINSKLQLYLNTRQNW